MKLKMLLVVLLLVGVALAQTGLDTNKTHFVIGRIVAGEAASDQGQSILENAYSELGYTVEFVYLQAGESLEQSNAGIIDGELFRVSGIQETYTNLVPVPVPFVVVENRLFAREDWTEEITTWDEVIPIVEGGNSLGIRIGLVKGEQQADSRGIPYTRFGTLEEALEMLSEGEIDLVYEESLATYEALNKLDIENVKALEPPLDSVALYHYVHKSNSFIVPELEIVLTDIVAEELQVKESVLTPEELAWLDAHPYMRVGIDSNWPPFDFIDDLGEYQGMCSEYTSIMGKDLDVIMAPERGLKWSEMMKKAEQGEIDVIPCILETEERSEYLLFTDPFVKVQAVVVTREDMELIADLSDMEGRTIAIERGYAGETVLKRDYPGIIQVPINTIEEGLIAVSEGRVDGLFDSYAVIKYNAHRLGLENLKIAVNTPYNVNLGFAVRKDWPELVTILNKRIATLSEEERTAIQDKWIALPVEPETDWGLVFNIVMAISLVAIIIIALVVSWNRSLAKSVEERTKELKKANTRLKNKTNKLERFTKLTEGREHKMIELKKKLRGGKK